MDAHQRWKCRLETMRGQTYENVDETWHLEVARSVVKARSWDRARAWVEAEDGKRPQQAAQLLRLEHGDLLKRHRRHVGQKPQRRSRAQLCVAPNYVRQFLRQGDTNVTGCGAMPLFEAETSP